MSLQIGKINSLKVLRETDISYTLTDGEHEVFLHFNQTPHPLKADDTVQAFLYYDQKKRLCATLENPIITTSEYGFVKVVAINENGGVFVNIGINKDILLSKDFLTISLKSWPLVGEELPCLLKLKSSQLVARIINKADEIEHPMLLTVGESATGIVSHISSEGIGLYTKDFDYVFIHSSLTRKAYHLGEVVTFKVLKINEHNEYDATTIQYKEIARLSDSDFILEHLKALGGVMYLGNASTPEEIEKELHISKSAFKRAMGNLYKNRLITIEDKITRLN